MFAFLDDVYVICKPSRVSALLAIVQGALRRHAGVEVNLGKTKVWNAAGAKPLGVDALGAKAWVGEGRAEKRGVIVLGAPIGSPEFVEEWCRQKLLEHRRLLERIPHIEDLQCAWIVLLLCASTRANYTLRNLPPHLAEEFAEGHDDNIWSCLQTLFGFTIQDGRVREVAQLPFREGGLGLRVIAISCAPSTSRR